MRVEKPIRSDAEASVDPLCGRGPSSAIAIERMVVGAGRLQCDVRLSPDAPRDTSAELMQRVCRRFPDLPRHSCINDRGATFGAVMDCTPLPHLLEHIVIDLQTRAAAKDDAVYVGTTEWLDRAAGTACIQVNFTDDIAALRAFRDATAFLNGCVLP